MKQEMNLIWKKDVKACFEKQWMTVYVPAIILYRKKSRKKSIVGLVSGLNELGKSM